MFWQQSFIRYGVSKYFSPWETLEISDVVHSVCKVESRHPYMDKHRLMLLNNSSSQQSDMSSQGTCDGWCTHAAAPRKLRQEDTDSEASLSYSSMLLFQNKQTYKQNKINKSQNKTKEKNPGQKKKKDTKQTNELPSSGKTQKIPASTSGFRSPSERAACAVWFQLYGILERAKP